MTEPLDLATNYTGGDYVYKMGGNGSTVVNGKKQIDCSHMVNLLLTGAGYSIPYEDTRVMENSTYYTTVLPQDVKRGDIALWINATPNSPGAPLFHTGIVQEFNAANRSGYIFGAQTSTGPARARFGPKPPSFFWPVATKFLRAKEEFRTGGAAPAPAATPAPAGPAPLMNFQYPFRKADGKQFTDAEEIYKALEGETAGQYLLGSNRFWHGGIHISDQSAPQCVLNEPIRCMADGEVVAYRLNEDYLESTFGDNEKKLKYSNSFCLVRHEYKSAPNPEEGANKGKQNKLTFYSLYMHLLPFARYPLSPAETPKPKVTMKVGDFRAYDTAPAPGVTTASCGQLAIGTKLEIIETAENGELTYAKGKILSGSVKQGATKKRVEGAEVWFAYLKNGEPYKNSVPKRIWLAGDVPERARPNYWQGKVKASVVNKLPLYDDPASPTNGQPAGARKGTLELVMNSVIEFNSSEVVNLALDGKLHRMAKCTMLSGGLRGHGAVPPSFWACVENDPANKVLKWDSVTPTSFDTVVMTSTGVKAGDPIGYLGQTENLTGENGGVSSKYQVHVEIFTADAEVKEFLKNTAGLKIGKQYLHLTSGAVLRQKAPATGTTALKQDHAVDLAKATVVKEGVDDWYEVSVIEDDQPVAGLIKKATAPVITQHDWEKLGFQIVEENNAAADGFLDPDAMPQFFKDLFAKIDKNHDGEVEPAELAEALKKPETRTQWARLVAHHPTEWKDKADSAKWSKLDKLLKPSPKMLKHEKERIDKYVFWEELSGKAAMSSSLIWHYHPIAFVNNFSGTACCELNKTNFRSIFGGAKLFTAPNMPDNCDAHDVDPQKFIELLNDAFMINGFDKCIYKMHFLAQCYHESDHFRTTKEYASGNDYDLSVHPASVCVTQGAASRTCRRHHQIMESGNTTVGDGPKYKGKGLIQITWKDAYEKYKEHSGIDCVANPEIISQSIEHAVNVSFWFWTIFKGENLNKKIDRYYQELNAQGGLSVEQIDDEVVRKVTKVVNGGSNHLAERQALFKKIKGELK
ncbi:glycoside hydrolase family 19 protein [Pseudomonas syringae]|uniref:glycoside hydrolase family 19 protein n=1 Tax=Pseudomonas syringae TaxID=317 RepID=UPI0004639D96|nr:glycoside hydrolase family 19 protein [Pseudomonas syringae]